jgi:phosphatidate cytidylyltransferase
VPAPLDHPAEPLSAPPSKFRDLKLRAASALVLAPLGLAAVYAGGNIFFAVVAILTFGLGLEWISLTETAYGAGLVVPFGLLISVAIAQFSTPHHTLAALLASALIATSITRRASTLTGVLYLGTALISVLYLRAAQHGAFALISLLLVVWSADVGAYLGGRFIGGPKLAPVISPGKTWSGALAGLLAGVIAGMVCARFGGFGASLVSMSKTAALSAAIVIASQLGDLLESAVKRRYGKKDSSQLIPGHGGLLDRLDAVLGAAFCLGVAYLMNSGAFPWR